MTIASLLRRSAIGLAVASPVALLLLACQSGGAASASGTDAADLALIQDVMRRVQQSYVAPVSRQQFVTNALKGALTGLDPHSDYMDEQEYHEMLSDTRGEFGGLGMELTEEHGVPKVISPIDDTPAARAGVRSGDYIVKIADQPTDNMSLKDVVDRLRGKPGTPIVLTILRSDTAPFDLTLTRAIIQIVSVKSHLEPNKIGYARISTFGEKTQDELADAIAQMKKQAGGTLNGFVLDLRNDPGGLLDAAVDVAGDFLDGGTVVSTHGRESEDDHAFDASAGGDRLQGAPVVVLINGASASASEIVAGALQDDRRATIMGTRSFGKGSVQTIIPLNGRGALRLTTARYYTPSGRSIQDNGVTPEIVVAVPKDAQVARGLMLHEADLRGALKNTGALGATRTGAPSTKTAAAALEADHTAETPIDPKIIGTAKDNQLAAALKYLEGKMAKAAAQPKG